MKNDLPFFSHDNDARNHPKMKALRAQYGPSGYGLFWMLNEMIAQAENARLDLSKKINRTATAGELGMTLEQFDAFLAFLSDPDYDLVNYADGILTTDRTQADYVAVAASREKNHEKYERRKQGPGKTEDSPGENSDSPGAKYTEQSREEQKREEQQQPRAGELSPELEQELIVFAIERARNTPGVKNVSAYAESIMHKPDVIAAFLASRTTPAPPKLKPGPNPCPHCGTTTIRTSDHLNTICPGCKTSWAYDDKADAWLEDEEKLVAFANTG